MGRIKDQLIDKMNNERNMPDDTDWDYNPRPIETSDDGKMLWIINDYRIWASSYQEALQLEKIIDKF